MKEIRYDTLYRRIVAKIIDYAILFFFIWLFSIFVPNDYYKYNYETESLELKGQFFHKYYDIIVGLFIAFYFISFHFLFARTFGKLITDVKLWDVNEKDKINFFHAFKRNIIDIILCVGLYFVSVDWISSILLLGWFLANFIQFCTNEKKRSLEDLIAGTVVLKEEIKKEIVYQD
jgi:uncharacterized RDD family membrane protein YckC